MLRTMNTEKSLKTLPILHQQLEALIQVDVQPNELTNGVINACFILLSKDLIRLFACYNDGIINLLGKTNTEFFSKIVEIILILVSLSTVSIQ